MNPNAEIRLLRRFHALSWLLAGTWTGCIAGSLLWNLHLLADRSLQLAKLTAEVTFENDVLYRRWAALKGGVYVPATADTPPNPYLQVLHRDVATTSGRSLTLINPAYMARQVNELAGATAGGRGHLTSLKPIRPENAPDIWEAAALRAFEQGAPEVSSVEAMPDGASLRLMRPFVTERSCLECHAAQGYREGDIRGGISVSVPLAPLRAIEQPMADRLTWAHAGLWLIGLAGIGLSRRSGSQEILAREQASAELQREVTERRLAEDKLREANERYELVLAGAEAGLWDWDVPRHTVVYSPRWKAMRGLAEADVRGTEREWSEGIHPEDAPRVMAAVQAHFAGQTPSFAAEYRVRRKDGTWIWIADCGLARRDAQGRVLRMAGSEIDITERKRVEEKLFEAHQRLMTLMNALPVGVSFSMDVTCRQITGNPVAMAQFESTPRDNLSASALDHAEPGRQVRYYLDKRLLSDADLPLQRAVAENREIPPMELEVCLPSGRRWFAAASGAPIRDRAGNVIGGVAVTMDITERKQIETERSKSEERYRSLFNAMTEGFALHELITDERGQPCDYRFLEVNPAFERLTGFPRAQLLGKRIREVMPAIETDWIEQYGRVALTGEPAHLENYSAALDRWFEAFAYRPAPGQFAVVFSDVTARRKTEAKLRQSTAELQLANASLRESRRAALNLTEDALAARQQAEQISADLRQEMAERERAQAALQRTTQRYALLSETAEALLAAPDPQTVVEALCRKVTSHLDCDVFINYLAEETAGRLRLNACAGIPLEVVKQIERLDYGVAVCGCVARDRRPRVAEDIQNTPDPRLELVKSLGLQAYGCHPLMAGGRLLGTLSFGARRRAQFSPDEVALMQAVTDQVATAMERIRIEEDLKNSLREKEVLLQEVHHRVKNNLQVISSLINLQAETLDQPVLRASLNDVRDRIHTMALVHEKLYQSGDLAALNFADYAASLLHSLWRAHGEEAAQVQLSLVTQSIMLPVGLAVPCGLILNELVSNALKHAFPGRAEGDVTVGLERETATHQICLRVGDNGTGLPAGLDMRHSATLGLRLVQMLTQQLGGTVEARPGPGAEFRIRFPAPEGV